MRTTRFPVWELIVMSALIVIWMMILPVWLPIGIIIDHMMVTYKK